jgi:hypothetical protein
MLLCSDTLPCALQQLPMIQLPMTQLPTTQQRWVLVQSVAVTQHPAPQTLTVLRYHGDTTVVDPSHR